MQISEDRYHAACNSYEGYCTHCEDFTRDMTEPDAEDYDCPECNMDTVVGTEQALLMDLLEFE